MLSAERLLSYKKNWNSDICYNIDGPWEHYTSWNTPDTEEQILDDYTYAAPRIEKFLETEGRLEVTKSWEGGKLLFNWYRVFWGMMKKF